MKKAAFCIGFCMLFWCPSDMAGVLPYFLVWLPFAVALMAYAGAFRNKPKTNQELTRGGIARPLLYLNDIQFVFTLIFLVDMQNPVQLNRCLHRDYGFRLNSKISY